MRLNVFEKQEALPANEIPDLAIVIDVLRATSLIVTALATGVRCVRPVERVQDALAVKDSGVGRDVVLAGERGGVAPPGFDLGNSPLAFRHGDYRDQEVVLCTSNGTRAVRALQGSPSLWAASLLNARSTGEGARSLAVSGRCNTIWLVCAGTAGNFSLEDFLCAGAIASFMTHPEEDSKGPVWQLNDQAVAARLFWQSGRGKVEQLLTGAAHGQNLLQLGFQDDVAFCAQTDFYQLLAVFDPESQSFLSREAVF